MSRTVLQLHPVVSLRGSQIDWMYNFPVRGGGMYNFPVWGGGASAHARRHPHPAHATGPGTQAPPTLHTTYDSTTVAVHGTARSPHISRDAACIAHIRAVLGGFSKPLASSFERGCSARLVERYNSDNSDYSNEYCKCLALLRVRTRKKPPIPFGIVRLKFRYSYFLSCGELVSS